jgi:hypothetical protein
MFSNFSNGWDTSSTWKQAIFHSASATCAGIEITTNHRNYTTAEIPNLYTSCGSVGMTTNPTTNLWTNTTPQAQQQGDYLNLCNYPDWTNCWHYTANEWITFTYHVHVGDWAASPRSSNSVVEVWVSRPSLNGGSPKKIIDIHDMPLSCNNDCSATSKEGYNNITLTPYMTQMSKSAPADAYIWYDELIVSTQPIATPGATAPLTPPAAPSSLILK